MEVQSSSFSFLTVLVSGVAPPSRGVSRPAGSEPALVFLSIWRFPPLDVSLVPVALGARLGTLLVFLDGSNVQNAQKCVWRRSVMADTLCGVPSRLSHRASRRDSLEVCSFPNFCDMSRVDETSRCCASFAVCARESEARSFGLRVWGTFPWMFSSLARWFVLGSTRHLQLARPGMDGWPKGESLTRASLPSVKLLASGHSYSMSDSYTDSKLSHPHFRVSPLLGALHRPASVLLCSVLSVTGL